MSIEAMSWALNDAPVDDQGQLCVLLGLANHADRYGRGAFPSQATLAEYARCGVRTVARYLNALEAAGVIQRGDQGHTAHLPGNRRPVVWDIAMTARGVTPDMPGQTCHSGRPANGDRLGVSPVADKPSLEPPVETSLGEVTTRGRARDPRRCDRHQDDRTPPPCGSCADARRNAERAEHADQADRRRAEHAERHARSLAHWRAIERCGLCDARGYLPSGAVCHHDPDAGRRAARGLASARAALRGAEA